MKWIATRGTPRIQGSLVVAIWLSIFSLFLFDGMGLIIKFLSPRYGAAELSAYRNFIGIWPSVIALWISASWHQKGRIIRIRQWRLAAFRGVVVSLAQFMFYLSLAKLAFATAATISYSNALFLTALAVPILGEKVGKIRWAAVLVGFFGVVMVMGPGRDTFTIEALYALGAAICYAFAAATSRLFDDDVPTPLANLYTQCIAAMSALVLVAFSGGFTPIQSTGDLGWIFLMGILGGSAVLALISAYRMTDSSNLAPFSYLGIPIAFVLGWLFYGEAPWRDLFPGSLLIIASGLLIVWRERLLRAKAKADASAETNADQA